MEECSIGAAHSLDAFNFLSGVLFAITFLTIPLVSLIFLEYINREVGTLLYHSITILLIVNIITGIGEIV